jgi:hypothetical protein
MLKTSEVKRKWFTSVSQKLGRVSVMMRGRDQRRISETGQVGSEELSSCQVGNEKRSLVDLKDCQVGSNESSYFQVGNEMRSLEDLIDCQEGRTKSHISRWAREKRRDCLTVS